MPTELLILDSKFSLGNRADFRNLCVTIVTIGMKLIAQSTRTTCKLIFDNPITEYPPDLPVTSNQERNFDKTNNWLCLQKGTPTVHFFPCALSGHHCVRDCCHFPRLFVHVCQIGRARLCFRIVIPLRSDWFTWIHNHTSYLVSLTGPWDDNRFDKGLC